MIVADCEDEAIHSPALFADQSSREGYAVDTPASHRIADVLLELFFVVFHHLGCIFVQWVARVGLNEQKLKPEHDTSDGQRGFPVLA